MEDYSFNGQREGEEVLQMVKNHPFVLFWPGLKAIFFLVLGIATIVFFSSQFAGLVLVVCVAMALGIFMNSYYNYSQSVFLVTNQRVLNVNQNGFFKRRIIETDINKIQDVSSDTSGGFKTMLKFGDLVIRTAGASKEEAIIVKNIANPYEVQQRIARIKD